MSAANSFCTHFASVRSAACRRHAIPALVLLALLSPAELKAQSQKTKEGGKPPARGVVCLKSRAFDVNDKTQNCSLLLRELFRQALLVAARDQLGLSTRESTLREPMTPLTNGKTVLEFETHVVAEKGFELSVFDASKGNEPLWKIQDSQPELRSIDYCAVATQAAKFSQREFVDLLLEAGYTKVQAAEPSTTKLPSFAREALSSMDYVHQFGAVRQIHSMIRRKGSSPELMSALIRGYANLAVLTEFHLTAASDVFRARSLIYAERLVLQEPDAADPLWLRAYARGLAGIHLGAMADIEAAKKMNGSNPPPWIPLIEALCRYDTEALRKISDKEGPWQELAMLLEFMTVEFSRSMHLVLTTAERMLDVSPTCYRVHDAMCNMGGVSNLHQATVYGPMIMAAYLPLQLADLPGLPKGLKRSLSKFVKELEEGSEDDDETEEDQEEDSESSDDYIMRLQAQIPPIVRSLSKSADRVDRGEPSWCALGNLIEDSLLVHLIRRAEFLKYYWGVESDDFVNASLPLVKRHPLALCLGSYLLDVGRDDQELMQLVQECNLDDIQMSIHIWTRTLSNIRIGESSLGWRILWQAMRYSDPTVFDLAKMESLTSSSARGGCNLMLLAASPDHPLGIANKILTALVTKYVDTGKPDDAILCFKVYLQIAPDARIFYRLAEIYKSRGDIDRWRDTLLEMLKHEDYGLQHASAQVEVANSYMKEGDYKKALPLAEEAAESWAHFAMECAVRANEGVGKWKRAELWARRITERYEGMELDWYFWCVRTGRGKTKAAEAIAEERVNRILNGNSTSDEDYLAACFLIVQDEMKEAKSMLKRSFTKSNNPFPGLFLAGLADIDKDAATRDDLLKQVIERGEEYSRQARVRVRTELMQFAKLLQKAHAGGPLNLAEVDKLAESGDPGEAANVYYFTSLHLQARGEKEKSIEYLKKAAEHPFRVKLVQMLACAKLRDLKIDYKHVAPYSGF